MPIFEWKGFDAEGKNTKGVIDADTERDARLRLRREQGVHVVNIREAGARERRKDKKTKPGKPAKPSRLTALLEQARGREGAALSKSRLEEVSTFTRQLATLLKAGIPVTDALTALVEQAENRRQEMLFRDLRQSVSQGMPTADALARHPGYFDELYISMVRSGEAAGRLDEVLERLGSFIQKQARVRNKVQAALTYPIIMLVIGVLVVAVLLVFVVPKITKLLEARGQRLPLPTQILKGTSEFLVHYWWLLLGGMMLSIILFNLYYATTKGRLKVDHLFLKLPAAGDLLRKQAVARFSQTLATLLRSGVPVVHCLEVVRTVLGNRVLENAIIDVREKVVEGADIATPFRESGVFPTLVSYMIAVGEQSGELDTMMEQIGESYDEEVEIATQKFTSLIEPILIVVLAVLVGFIVLSILWPVLLMSQSI